MRFFEHHWRVQFEGCVVEPLQTITAILCGSQWSCSLHRIVPQDVLREVMKVLSAHEVVDDVAASVEGRYEELPGISEKVLKSVRLETEEKEDLSLSSTEERQGSAR